MTHYAEPDFLNILCRKAGGKYQNFVTYIPWDQRYWLGENGRSLIRE